MAVPKPKDEEETRPPTIFSQIRNLITSKLDDVEDVFTPTPTSIFASLASRDSSRNRTPRFESLASPFLSESESGLFSTPDSYSCIDFRQVSDSGSSEFDDTPPLTPESLIADIELLASPASVHAELGYDEHDMEGYGHGQEDPDVRPHSLEIKEGKRPAPPIDFDALLVDISVDTDNTEASEDGQLDVDSISVEDKEEWYGLEYTLELSTRERRVSETQVHSAGEHSKSRESWAAIHQGTEYHQWKNWHRYLDRQDDKRKHRRGRAFKAHAKELALFYAEQVHTKDLIEWQEQVYGEAERALKEHLALLEAQRPDPYNPPHQHGHLKRSRTVASLRELQHFENE
ncbi:hypothetical protein FB45DRAFT_902689 [Roridomyces roridus]|uniref:Uncharacterized protein n=1 Tax=Roridomyces roridus TaxID=1738132 RepID=A0AAD7FUM1_9AGAR|nr:hypothetical protein FB45DRAFT_902689 [Roridomyces roridus]